MKPFAAVVLLFFVLGIGVPAQAQFYSGYCPTCAAVVYDTCWGPAPCANSFANGAISATMATLTSATRYRFNVTMSQHTVGTLCGTTTATVTVSYTDSDSGQSISSPVVGLSGTSGTPIATWTIPNSLGPTSTFRSFAMEFTAATGSVQFAVVYSGCSGMQPTYAFYPHLEQLP